eukprot:TRINITY_DN2470_c0_g1_i4.p1 TRINITY_DN2470_c0_g1~~TRINITY_DN2470_c0_g1_i4.p1  ORF type:complete len:124 (+),score=14.98 TRINITY_DN2470_c0_g1_i4:654-1025(+)
MPFYATMRSGTNNQYNLVEALFSFSAAGALQRGDVLVIDNAAIHVAVETAERRSDVLREMGVTLMLLPAYSPELNPCERVWRMSQSWLRWNSGKRDFVSDILLGLSLVTDNQMRGFYRKSWKL